MLRYKKDILKELKEAGYNQTYLIKNRPMSQSAVQALRKGEIVGTKSLDAICTLLKCQPGELIEWIPDQETAQDNPEA